MAKAKKKKKAKAKAKIVKKVSAIPTGYSTLTPGFATTDGSKAIDFLQKAFGAKLKSKYTAPDGSVVHCEMKIGDTVVMFGAPMDGKPYNVHAMIYVKDCDSVFQRALAAGATQKKAVEDQFYGDRGGSVTDPFGNEWFVATHVENVPKKEMDRRMALVMQGQSWK